MTNLESALRAHPFGRGATYRHEHGGLSVRYFGHWFTPSYVEDEDYDWEEPSEETVKVLTEIAKVHGVTFGVEEKNYVFFQPK